MRVGAPSGRVGDPEDAVGFEGAHLGVWDPLAEGVVVLIEFGVHSSTTTSMGSERRWGSAMV